ncbi:hypothetical protein GGI04_001247 [Coemansia thaxteri]|nr:hypothetical protein GGI04_001247 [Coemansia thaxteri]
MSTSGGSSSVYIPLRDIGERSSGTASPTRSAESRVALGTQSDSEDEDNTDWRQQQTPVRDRRRVAIWRLSLARMCMPWRKRRVVTILLAVAFATLLVAAGGVLGYNRWVSINPKAESVDPSLFPSGVDAAQLGAGQTVVRVIHINDMHARYHAHTPAGDICDPAESAGLGACTGGAAYVKTLMDHLRGGAGVQRSLVLNAGDELQGSELVTLFGGRIAAAVINELAPDVLSPGNHEFDGGADALAAFLARVRAPAVCANVDLSGAPRDLQAALQPFAVLPGNVGVVGVLTPTAEQTSQMRGVRVSDAAAAVNAARVRLNARGVRRVVVLSHLGYADDVALAAALDPGVALVVGGHTHTLLGSSSGSIGGSTNGSSNVLGPYPTWVANAADAAWMTAVVQAKSYGDYVGVLDAVFNDDGSLDSRLTRGRAVPVDIRALPREWRAMRPSAAMAAVLKPFEDEAAALTSAVVGVAAAEFVQPAGNRDAAELALGDLAADALAWAANASVAVLGTGSLRTRLPAGNVTHGRLMRLLSFDDVLARPRLSGSAIRAMIKSAALGNSAVNSRPVLSSLQAAGLRYANDTFGEVKVRVGIAPEGADSRPPRGETWEALDDAGWYEVVAPMFLLSGGDNILSIDNSTTPVGLSVSVRESVERYITRFSPVAPTLDRRK